MKNIVSFNVFEGKKNKNKKFKKSLSSNRCPICDSKLKIREYGLEHDSPEWRYFECPKNSDHYSEYLGLIEDLDE